MKAVAFLGRGKAGIIDVPDPVLKPGQVLVRTTRSAICGSDTGAHGATFMAERKQPCVVGHESLGIVEDGNATGFKPGRRVAILVVTGCMSCPACLRGRFTLCDSPGAVPQTNAERIAVPAANLIPLPDDVSFEKGLLGFGCGIGVALGGVHRLSPKPGEIVGVMGLGPIGLCTVEVLKQQGIRSLALDVNRHRLQTARKLGAEFTSDCQDLNLESIRRIQGGRPIKHLILCAGSQQAVVTGLELLAKEGTMIILGGASLAGVDSFGHIISKEITISGSWHYGMENVPEILSILAAMEKPELILTHIFPKEKCQPAYELFVSGNCGKVLLNWE